LLALWAVILKPKAFPTVVHSRNFPLPPVKAGLTKIQASVKITEWHRIVLNNRLGEVAQQYLKKGSKVYIEGSLRTRKWTDKDGQERFTTEIRGDSMQMLDGPRGGQGEGSQNMDYAPYSARSGNGQSGNNYSGNNQSGDNQYSSGQGRNTGATSSPQYNTDLDDDLPF